jgi:hypothetical protein
MSKENSSSIYFVHSSSFGCYNINQYVTEGIFISYFNLYPITQTLIGDDLDTINDNRYGSNLSFGPETLLMLLPLSLVASYQRNFNSKQFSLLFAMWSSTKAGLVILPRSFNRVHSSDLIY